MTKKNILYIDDCMIEQELASLILKEEGFNVDCCATLPDAEKYMKDTSYHIVYIDWNLKKHIGVEVAETLRKNFPVPQYYLISSFLTQKMIDTAKQKGFDHCYEKDAESLFFKQSLEMVV